MQAWFKYREWQEWCYENSRSDSDYFNKAMPVTVLGISDWQPFQEETLYVITQYDYWHGAEASIPLRFLSLEYYDNIIE